MNKCVEVALPQRQVRDGASGRLVRPVPLAVSAPRGHPARGRGDNSKGDRDTTTSTPYTDKVDEVIVIGGAWGVRRGGSRVRAGVRGVAGQVMHQPLSFLQKPRVEIGSSAKSEGRELLSERFGTKKPKRGGLPTRPNAPTSRPSHRASAGLLAASTAR